MKAIQWIISALVAVVIIAAAVGGGVYFTRLKSIHSIRKLTDYENYNLYRMDIDYAYDLDRLIDRGITDNQSMINAILAEALPYLPIHMKAPNFGCSAFCTQGTDGHTLMGRNYDFKNDTSAMLVYCTPKDGYASVAFAALDNINANTPDASMAKKLATLTAPFICLDGMNEKGVSIAVLTLDSDPTYQQTGKPMIATTLAIRLVLDRAATTAEAVELLSKYDMFASSGRDYHFYITDASGDGRVLEYDCNDPAPESLYGKSKLAGEEFVRTLCHRYLIVRSAWVYGIGRDFVSTVLNAAADPTCPWLAVPTDRFASPTSADDLTAAVEQLIDHDTLGIYHIVCQGRCSRYDFAKAILKAAHMEDKLELHPIRAADAGSTPSYTVLDNLMLRLDNLPQPRPWKEALNEYINSLQ